MSELTYIKFFVNWIELMETKDTEEKQLAFIRGIFDAYKGVEPPRPQDMDDPHGTDYARRDGYLVAKPVICSVMTHAESGRLGGLARSTRKAEAVRQNGVLGGRPKRAVECASQETENQSEITKANNLSEKPKQNNLSFNIKNKNKNKRVPEDNIPTEKISKSIVANRESIGAASAPTLSDAKKGEDLGDGLKLGVDLPPMDRPITAPNDKELEMAATQMGIPKDYIPSFVKNIQQIGWGYINRGGSFVTLNRRNCKAILSAFWNSHQKSQTQPQNKPAETIGLKIETDDDYSNRF